MTSPGIGDAVKFWFPRFGEATNPGPGLDSVAFAAINPTTILHKVPELLELGAHVVVASETAANRAVQSTVTRQLRQHKFRCHWGPPVPDRVNADTGRVGMRGAALGTATFSALPSRSSLEDLPDFMSSSCRISESFIRLFNFEVRIIALYGFPQCLPDAALKNNLLLSWAHQRATGSRIPTLVAGDLNAPVQSLFVWASFQQLGWVELHDFMLQAYQLRLPPTCRSATHNDTFLISSELLPYVAGADVYQPALFNSACTSRV